jgi:hypothetical protein
MLYSKLLLYSNFLLLGLRCLRLLCLSLLLLLFILKLLSLKLLSLLFEHLCLFIFEIPE